MFKYKTKKWKFTKKNLQKAPKLPGVYTFYNNDGVVLYVGKSVELRSRLKSYKSHNLLPKTTKLVSEITHFSLVKVSTELESLLLEAKLINGYKPKYNLVAKDDKSPLYIKITKDEFPRVLTARKTDLGVDGKVFFGPFPSGKQVRQVLKLIRKAFSYSDHKIAKKPCLWAQIGQCNPCPSDILNQNKATQAEMKKAYLKNIRMIKSTLSGNFTKVAKDLETEMKRYSKNLQFEKAIGSREKLISLHYVLQPITPITDYLKSPNMIEDIRQNELDMLQKELAKYLKFTKLSRVECFDVSHVSGSSPAASMVTFIKGEPEKSLYRRFRIKQRKGMSDTDSLMEVARRRKNNLENWGKPDLIIVDGGKGQVTAFTKGFTSINIPIIGFVKRPERIVVQKNNSFIAFRPKSTEALFLLQRLRDEAHRFAQKYHHNIVNQLLLGNKKKS